MIDGHEKEKAKEISAYPYRIRTVSRITFSCSLERKELCVIAISDSVEDDLLFRAPSIYEKG